MNLASADLEYITYLDNEFEVFDCLALQIRESKLENFTQTNAVF